MRRVVRGSLPPYVRNSLDSAWKEGVSTQIVTVLFDFYLIPFALFLGAGAARVGLLIAVPNLIASLAYFLSVRAVSLSGGRLGLMLRGTGAQALIMAPLALLPFLPAGGRIVVLIAAVTLYRVLSSFIGPAWGSLVSDYLPGDQRGQYLGWRARMTGIAGMAAIIGWGGILSFVKRTVSVETAFAALFAGGILFRGVSWRFMSRMTDLPHERRPDADFTFLMFLKSFRHSNFVKFILYMASITFATQLASPYFSVHMLKNLDFNYLQYMSVHLASVATGLVGFPLWGRHGDAVGNAKVLKSTSVLIPVIPFLWMIARSPLQLIIVEGISGFIWSGFILASSNFIYDAVTPPKRVRCIGYYNAIIGFAVFAGASLGGFIGPRLPPLLGYPLVSLFLLSAVLRLASDLVFSRYFGEVRPTPHRTSSTGLYLSVTGIRPLIGKYTDMEFYPDIRPPRRNWSIGH